MTSPMVDTVRNIPLIVERDRRVPMDAEMKDETGFPFDREARDDDAFQSQLDDLAKRHPEFAEHFGGFPFREGGSSSSGPRPRREHPEFRRFTDRPFGQRFERFGFPGRDLFHENYPNSSSSQEQPAQPPQPHQHQAEAAAHSQAAASAAAPPPPPPSSSPPKQEEAAASSSKPPEVPQENRRRQPNIQQSNTVDLGQKQEPVNDRNQRSMSAPPSDSRGGQQRFVSSIQIPINSGGMGDMGGQQSTQEKPTQAQPPQHQPHQQDKAAKPMERVIPIHVEGRDEPVMPKHAGPAFAQQQQHQPQPETIFGQRPGKFTQYVPRQFGQSPFEDPIRQQQQYQQPKFQQQPQKPATAPHPRKATSPQPQAAPQPQPQPQPQRQQTPPQQPKPQTPIDIIQSIQKDVSELMSQVEKFDGQPRDKQYIYLDEMLTRNLLKLDNVDTQGQENIRSARKEAIKCIERCIGVLEAKAAANVPQPQQMEVETKAETQLEEVKPEEPSNSEEAAKAEEPQEQMDVEKPAADEPQAPKAEEESMEVADEPDKKKKSKQKKAANE